MQLHLKNLPAAMIADGIMLVFGALIAKKSSAHADLGVIVKLRENEFNPEEKVKKATPKETQGKAGKKQVGALEQKPNGGLKNMVSRFTPVLLYIDGWGVTLSISPFRGGTEASLTAGSYNERTKGSLLQAPLSPNGKAQRITAKVTASYGFGPWSEKIVLMDVDTIVTPKTYQIEHGGIKITCEYPGMENAGYLAADMAGSIRNLSKQKDKINIYLFSNEAFNEPHYDGNEIYITAKHKSEVAAIACHEETHAAYQRMVNGNEKSRLNLIDDAYGKLVDAIRIDGNVDLRKEDVITLNLWQQRSIVSNRVVKSYRDGEYPGLRWYAGHPWDNPSELFASATTILKLYPERFFHWLSMDEQVVPQTAAITRKIAIDIVNAWGKESPFSPIVYEKLGLKKP